MNKNFCHFAKINLNKKCYKNYKKFKILFDSICMSKYRKQKK